jgi:hypothetical protein
MALDYMWGHHPTFGAPLIGPASCIDTGARWFSTDDEFEPIGTDLAKARRYAWPTAETVSGPVDLSGIPATGQRRALLGYLGGFETGWLAVSNRDLGLGLAVSWPADILPYAWMWQNLEAIDDYPWYGSGYAVAIEPFSSYPGQGLATVMEKTATHRSIEPGASEAIRLTATVFRSQAGVHHVMPSGQVQVREIGDRR